MCDFFFDIDIENIPKVSIHCLKRYIERVYKINIDTSEIFKNSQGKYTNKFDIIIGAYEDILSIVNKTCNKNNNNTIEKIIDDGLCVVINVKNKTAITCYNI